MDKKIVEYRMVIQVGNENFVEDVNSKIRDGW